MHLSQLLTLVLAFTANYPHVTSRRLRIANGNNTEIEDHPHQVSIQDKEGRHLCGGSIISEKYILTAGHCINEGNISPTKIRAGSKFYWENGSLHQVIRNYKHSDWNIGKDIAILEVKEPFTFDKTHQPIKLADSNSILAPGTLATVSGWGNIVPDHLIFPTFPEEPDQLQAVEVPIVDRKTCGEVYNKTFLGPIVDSQICAGDGVGDACRYDSGGALVVDGRQVGIVSKGMGCALPKYPGIYTDVAYFREWIRERTNV